MNQFLVVEFSKQNWGIEASYVVLAVSLPKESLTTGTIPDQICVRHRAVPLVEPASFLLPDPTIANEPTSGGVTKAVVISRGNLWLALTVSEVLAVMEVETSHATWAESYLPMGVRRDLIQGVGTTSKGNPLILIHAEALISTWQQQKGNEAFPLPAPLRLGEKILSDQPRCSYSGPDRRSHLRLERTEWVLIQKSKESGYPAYRTIISFQDDLKKESVGLTRVMKLLQQLGRVIGADSVYKPKILGKFGRHLGLLYVTHYPPETVLNRLHELEEVDNVEMVSFRE